MTLLGHHNISLVQHENLQFLWVEELEFEYPVNSGTGRAHYDLRLYLSSTSV